MKNLLFACCLLLIFGMGLSCSAKKVQSGSANSEQQLNGSWDLNYITGPRIAFEGLYPNKKPSLTFDLAANRLSGNTSCNSFSGALNVQGNAVSFKEPLAMTKMFCEGGGETTFLETLKKVTGYAVSDDSTLTLLAGDIALMRFVKQ